MTHWSDRGKAGLGSHSAAAIPRVVANEIPRILRFLERPELASEIGLPDEVIDNPDARIPIDAYYQFFEDAVTATGDPCLGARYGMKVHTQFRENAGIVGLMFLSSPTLRVGLDRLLRYRRHWNEGERFELVELREGRLRIRYHPWGATRPAHAQIAEKNTGQLLIAARMAAAGGPIDAEVTFTHPARGRARELASILRCRPVFGAQHNDLVLSASVLDAKFPTADTALFRVLDRQLAEKINATHAASGLVDRARKVISDYLHDEQLSIATVARRLTASERTLQRRLTDEKTSFRALVDEVRQSRAMALLRQGASIAEVTLMLGYQEESAFFRAFKRWTDTTPEEWRAAAGADAVTGRAASAERHV